MTSVCIEADDLGESVVLHFGKEMQAVEALQVVEPVAVLQLLELDFEHEVEGRTQHAAERKDFLREATNPQVDIVEAGCRDAVYIGPSTGAVEEIDAFLFQQSTSGEVTGPKDHGHGDVAFAFDRGLRRNQRMQAICSNEVDDRGFVLEVAGKLHPAIVGLEFGSMCTGLKEVAASGVQRRHAGIPTARQIDGCQIERQPEQVVAQRTGDELVDLIADLARHAANDIARSNAIGDGMARIEFDRVEETLDQADLIIGERGVEPVDLLVQHGVAEAVNHVGELGHDGRVDVGMIAVGNNEEIDIGLNLAGKILEHRMLVLHFGAELGGLEQALAVPGQGGSVGGKGRRISWNGIDLGLIQVEVQPLVDKGHVLAGEHDFLGMLYQPVMLGMEDVVDGGQADVFIDAAVAGNEVRIEQFIVIDCRVVAGVEEADFDVAIGNAIGDSVMGDIGQKCRIDANGACKAHRRRQGAGNDDIVSCIGNAVHAHSGNDLRKTCRIGNEVAVGVGAQQGHRADVLVGQEDAKHLGLFLDLTPGRHAARLCTTAFDEVTSSVWLAIRTHRILAQEHLVGGVRRIGLVLVDERRRGVDGAHVIGAFINQESKRIVAKNTIGAG